MTLAAFTVIAAIGIVIALIGLLAGDLLDGALDLDFMPEGIVSTTSIAALLSGYGLSGIIAIKVFDVDAENKTTLLFVSVAFALGAWLSATLLYRGLKRAEPSPEANSLAPLVGAKCVVLSAPGSIELMGEVSVVLRGQTRKMNFLSDSIVTTGQALVIDEVLTENLVRASA